MPEEPMSETQRKFWFYFSALTIIAGIAFYWVWGLMFGTWNLFATENLGAYSITVLLIAFGIVGVLLTKKPETAK